MSLQTYGTLDATIQKNVKITFSSQLANGTSAINTGGTVTIEFDCLWTDYASNVPAQFSVCPLSGFANFLLVNSQIEMRPLAMAHITLTFQASYSATPPTQYTEQNGTTEEDIQNHPSFGTWVSNGWVIFDENGVFQGFTQDSGKAGVTSYIVGTKTVIKKAFFSSKPSDASDTQGKTSSPGLDYTGSWLVIGSVRGLEGIWWTQTTTYKFSAVTWDSDIYPAV
jgi:hypothetical protein